MPRATRNAKCTCNPGWMFASAIIFAIGLILLVQGFIIQFQEGLGSGSQIAWVFGYYLIGIIFVGTGKLVKWKAYAMCPAHGRKMM